MTDEIKVYDDILTEQDQRDLYGFLSEVGWAFAAFSSLETREYRFWCRHFASYQKTSNLLEVEQQLQSVPLVQKLWTVLKQTHMHGHTLGRCYANAYPFGTEGYLHTDIDPDTEGQFYTALYYPQLLWHPDWGGEIVFFNKAKDDLIKAIYPKPGRLVIFNSVIPHAARPVTRLCRQLRIALAFKTQIL